MKFTVQQELILCHPETRQIGVYTVKKVHPKSVSLTHVAGFELLSTKRPVNQAKVQKYAVG